MPPDLLDRGIKVGGHLLYAAAHARNALGVMLEIAKHLGKVLRPGLQLHSVFHRNTQHFRGYRVRKRLSKVSYYIHPAFRNNRIEETLYDVTYVATENFDSMRCKCMRRQSTDAGVCRRV